MRKLLIITTALVTLAACGGSDEPNLLNISQPALRGSGRVRDPAGQAARDARKDLAALPDSDAGCFEPDRSDAVRRCDGGDGAAIPKF